MKLSLNPDFAKRYLGVAVLFFGLSLWFLHDAVFVYPNQELKPGEHRTTVEFQYSAAGLLALASFFIASRVLICKRNVVEWDEEKMWGPGIGRDAVKFSEIVGVDDCAWKNKGIIVFLTKDGRSMKFDAWHHVGVDNLVDKILSLKKA